MTARTGWRLAMMAGAMTATAIPAFAPAIADVRAGADAWARGDYSRAVAEWRGPAVAGDADAQFNMGQAYKLGRGVPADLPQAEEWYQKAAVQGHEQAQDNYGLALFQDGRKTEALPWLEKAVARDEKRTELVLGTMLFNGDGVPKDWVRAYGLVSRSSQQGLPQASKTLAQMDDYLSPEERQQGVALAGRIADQGRSAQVAALVGPAAPKPSRGEGSMGHSSSSVTAPSSGSHAVQSTDTPPSVAPVRGGLIIDASLDNGSRMARAGVHALPVAPPPKHQGTPRPPAMTAGGHWHVQLGAFRDEGNARALWGRIGARVGGQPVYARAGGVSRLQAGPFASKADAARACHAAGTSCVVIP